MLTSEQVSSSFWGTARTSSSSRASRTATPSSSGWVGPVSVYARSPIISYPGLRCRALWRRSRSLATSSTSTRSTGSAGARCSTQRCSRARSCSSLLASLLSRRTTSRQDGGWPLSCVPPCYRLRVCTDSSITLSQTIIYNFIFQLGLCVKSTACMQSFLMNS